LRRDAGMIQRMAPTTMAARITRSTTPLIGKENPSEPVRPAHAKKMASHASSPAHVMTDWMPTDAAAASVGTPAFCRKRTLSVMPPTLFGVTRFMNALAIWSENTGPKGSRSGMLPTMRRAAAK
jgi:hypothetical protein